MKYGNRKTVVDGIIFDSKKEAEHYTKLLAMIAAGYVTRITRQPRYELQGSFEKDGKKFRKMEYVADFEVTYADGHVEVIDVKGMRTDVYKLKRKMFEYKYPDKTIVEV